MPMWNVTPGPYTCSAASRDRWVATTGAGSPGYVTMPSTIGWLRSTNLARWSPPMSLDPTTPVAARTRAVRASRVHHHRAGDDARHGTVGAMSDSPPPTTPPSTPPPPPPPPPPTSALVGVPGTDVAIGPLGARRSTGLVILLSIVTCGIWTFVWAYQNGKELKDHTGTGLGGVAYLIVTLLV